MRLIVYSDCTYTRADGVVYGDVAFSQFIVAVGRHFDQLTVIGRVSPDPTVSHYPLPDSAGFLRVPHYESLTRRALVLRSFLRSLRPFWRALDDADTAWVMGPYLHGALLALLGKLRGRRVVLGVRQDFPSYVRGRRPDQRWMHVAADALELAWRALAHWCPVVAVGPELASHYDHAPDVLATTISLITEADVAEGRRAAGRSYDGELTLLSVSRLDKEKNPLLLADAFAALRRRDGRWRMIVCGDGPLRSELTARLASLGVAEFAELPGYVSLQDGLLKWYRSSHAFLHVSLTEGFPQVLLEAFASGVPVVATAVGGVPAAAGDAALLIPPSEAEAAATAVHTLSADPDLRQRLVAAGLELAEQRTVDLESARVAAFIAG